MTKATLTGETNGNGNGAAASTMETNGNGSSSPPTHEDEIASFDEGRSSNAGNGSSNNGNGSRAKKGRKKNKKKNKLKKKSSADDSNNGRDGEGETPSSSTDLPPSVGDLHNGDKRSRDDLVAMAASSSSPSRPQKKQRQRSMSSTSTQTPPSVSQLLLTLIFFALGTFLTMPLIFSTVAYVSCGRTKVDALVDSVLIKKARGGEESMTGWMRHLNSISGDRQKHSSGWNNSNNGSGDSDRSQEQGRRKKASDNLANRSEQEALTELEPLDIHESMCQVSSLAIGHFVHYFPYYQWLVLRNPLAALVDVASLDAAREMEQKEEESERKGIFQRVLSKHKRKHQEYKQSSGAMEEIDRKHPLRHIIEGASIFLHHRKEKKMRRKEEKQKKKQKGQHKVDGGESEVDWKKWKYAMSDDYELTPQETQLLKEFSDRIAARAEAIVVCHNANTTECDEKEKQIASLSGGTPMPNQPFRERLDAVAWGGIDADPTRWWGRKHAKDTAEISAHDGGRLMAAYLKIMKWPTDMHAKYPFRLCAKGCDAEVSVLHTLEWRQKYRPWCVSRSTMAFNKDGFIYSRGHSRPGPKQRLEAQKSKDANSLATKGHSMVYYRPGLSVPANNPELYMRAMTHALEAAVADALRRSDGAVGRFNVVMDCAGMGSGNSPSIAQVKVFFSVLQDHFPDRLGVLLAVNLSGLTQMLMKMVLPFVTEDVRAKIHIIPNDPEERRAMLSQFVEEEQVPHYLGGKDEYRFDTGGYYGDTCVMEEEELLEYRTTMPYHA